VILNSRPANLQIKNRRSEVTVAQAVLVSNCMRFPFAYRSAFLNKHHTLNSRSN